MPIKRSLKYALAGLAGIVGLGACSAVNVLNSTVPSSGYTIEKDIAYGTDERQKLDIYVPENLTGPVPVVLFFYGGSWQWGSKGDYLFVGQALASAGFVTVIADYRVYPQVSFPVFNEDGASALKWVHDNIEKHHGDSKNLFLAGHSAGAYIAVMLTANKDYLAAVGGDNSWVRGTIGIAGPYDFLPLTDPKLITLFSTAKAELTQPVHYIDRKLPPVFLAYGDADETVLPRNSKNLAAKLLKVGSPVELHEYKNVAHIGIILSLARGFRYKTPLRDQITAFIREYRSQ